MTILPKISIILKFDKIKKINVRINEPMNMNKL